ncbi:MAG: hypothetical protein ABI442_21575 [Gemmatimonadaceae bacterium]
MPRAIAEFSEYKAVANIVAHAFNAGEQTHDACVERAIAALGKAKGWVTPLARRYLHEFSGNARPRQRDVARFLLSEALRSDEASIGTKRKHINVRAWLTGPWQMRPVAVAVDWNVPAIESIEALASWCSVSIDELAWFADIKTLGRKNRNSPLHHYHYRVGEKQSGGIRPIEAPQKRIKQIQRRILAEILERVPHYYNAAHGFVKARSVQTFAAPHVGKRVVLRMDLQDLFPRISRARVQAIFRAFGYPDPLPMRSAPCARTPRRQAC